MLALLGAIFPLIGPLAGPLPAAVAGAVTADLGVEYDSNANRALADGSLGELPRSGPLVRLLASGTLRYAEGRQRLNLQLISGGKLYLLPEVWDQSIGVVQLNYEHGGQLRRARLAALIDYYESFQAPAAPTFSRDLRSLAAGGRLSGSRPLGEQHSLDGGLDLTALLFFYKPSPAFSFLAPSATARLNTRLHAGDPELGHDFDLGASARIDYRSYTAARDAVYLQGGVTAAWQGPVLLQLGYTAQIHLASVSEESYQRHLVLAKVAFRIPGDLYLTLKGQLSLIQSAPGLYIPVSSIDEDSRSVAVLDLERPLPRGFALSARYTGYFGLPIDNTEAYTRHTVFLGLSYTLKRAKKSPNAQAATPAAQTPSLPLSVTPPSAPLSPPPSAPSSAPPTLPDPAPPATSPSAAPSLSAPPLPQTSPPTSLQPAPSAPPSVEAPR